MSRNFFEYSQKKKKKKKKNADYEILTLYYLKIERTLIEMLFFINFFTKFS